MHDEADSTAAKRDQRDGGLREDGSGCSGKSDIDTGVGFFDHMLTLFAFHSGIDLQVKAKGDLHVCDHHLIEDTGIVLGGRSKKRSATARASSGTATR